MEYVPTVLVVDDFSPNLALVAHHIKDLGCEPILFETGQAALDYVKTSVPDLILLDIMMPDMDGFETCKHIKEIPSCRHVPIIFLTASRATDDMVQGFMIGGADYLTKPFSIPELKARVSNQLSLRKYREEIELYNEKLKKANKELNEINQIIQEKNIHLKEMMIELDKMSKTDALTGLYNRRYITEKMQNEISRFAEHGKEFSVIITDIDSFKLINDNSGHNFGDKVLKAFSERLLSVVRPADIVARWGGEEFLIFLPDMDLRHAIVTAEMIRKAVCMQPLKLDEGEISITITLGISSYRKATENLDDIIFKADKAMYIGKRNGKNQVVTL